MNLGKKLAVIAQLALLNAVWLLNIAVYQKYNYFSEARHLRYIPETSLICGSVRTGDIAGKLIHQYLYNRAVFETYFRKHELKSLAESSPFKMGVDPNDQVSFYAEHNDSGDYLHAGIFVDLLNEEDFHTYLKKNKWKKLEKTGSLHVFSGKDGLYAVNNDEVVLMMKIDLSVSREEVLKTITAIYAGASEKNKMRETLLGKLKENHDFVITGHSRELFIQSPLLNRFVITGEFANDRIAMLGDFYFNREMETVFPEHAVNPSFNFDEQEGFFLLQGDFNIPNSDILPENLGVISMNDSLSRLLKKTLHSRSCSKLQFMAHDFRPVKISSNENYSEGVNFALGMGLGMLPEFKFTIHCMQASKMDSLLRAMSLTDTALRHSDEGFYRYRYSNYNIYMKAHAGVFNIQSNRDMHQLEFPQTGYSNFIFLDYNKMRESIPDLRARMVATEYDLLKHVLFYSTGCKGNVLTAKGEMVIEKNKNALLEVFKTDDKVLKWKELKQMLSKETAEDFE